MESTEQLRPEELVGLVARSAEGTAAKGMPIKGHEDLWVEIQANTFRNWVNEHLKHAVDTANSPVIDLVEDFRDGTRLCALVEVLTKRRLPRWNPRPANQHHHLENVSTALQAIEADGVKLVNIGNVDIVNGNLKLILGLIWSLIVRYQIGKSKFPPRKLMLAWLKTVLPECRVNNFTTDWNSGVYLSALLDYCQPGLFPHWRRLDPNDSVYNCRKAMEISKREFDIPMVLEPEYLASPYMDELSGMTYLSYFMKEGSPGFHATLRWVNSQLSHPVQNFTTDWNDGRTLCSIVRNLGGSAPAYDKIDVDPSMWEHNIQMGIDGGKKLGVEPILKAKDMADQNVEHLGVMAYAACFQWVKPRPQTSKQIVVHIDSTSARVQQPAHFKLEILTKEVNTREVRGEVISPSGRIECRLTWNGVHGKGTFIPVEVGMHKLMVYNDGELVDGCPYYFRVLPPLTKIKSPGMDPCAIGSIVEVLVNSYGTSHDGIDVTAWSPTGRSLLCPVKENDGVHTATFQPDETGEWSIAITHKGNHIQGGPFTCFVFDPNGIKLLDTEGALPGQPFSFTVDATGTGGLGDVIIDLVHDKQSIPFRMENSRHMQYRVSFVPSESGKYRVYIYFNGSDVRGSPFSIRVGTQKGSKRSKESNGVHERYFNNVISSSSTQDRNYEFVTGSALETLPIHRPATFTIDQNIDASKVTVNVCGPSGKIIPIQKSTLRGLTYSITAQEVGEHIIQILVNGQHIQGSPFRSQAYNAHAIQVGNIPNGVVNQPVEFEIDGSNAGSGNLEILVNGGHVTSFVRALGSQRFLASFVPHEAVVHLVEMTFNGEVVPGSPWRVGIMPVPKMSVIGDSIRLVPAGSPAFFELSALGFNSNEIDVQIITPSKRYIQAKIDEVSGRSGEFRVEFTPIEVGSHLVEVTIAGQKLPAGPLVAKVYNSSLIQVTDVPSAVVGHACQFRVDASAAGEGQLEISINEGEVPNHVQVVGGGRCLVSFTPETAKSHYIDIKFNGEAVKGCPFICNVSDTSRVTLSLNHLELIPVDQPASFHMGVDGSGNAELAVSVKGPNCELPVKVTGDIKNGFTAEFIPRDVGVHSISVEYNGHAVNGTPFLAKAFNADKVLIGPVARGSVGQPTHFTVDASQAGEGNLEITISARNQNIPTQVTPQGNARFSVSFVPFEACEHIINIAFNKRTVPGCPIITRVGGDSHVTVSGQALSSAGLGRQSYLTISNVAGSLEDLEVNVEGPNGQAVPAQVTDNKDTTCSVAFTPRVVGEHRISVSHRNVPVIGSPFSCKVYDVTAIKVKDAKHGVIGMPVTFLVETSQAGPGNLEVTVNGGRVPTSAQAQGPHTYAISFTPREPIVHTVDLRFNGEDVPGSPFSCQVSDTAKVIITEGLEKVSVNRLTTFTIEADISLGTPIVEVLSPTRESLPIHVKQSGHGCYTAGFTPKDVGDHSVEVKINGLHVEGSPFLVKAYNADKVKVTDINSGIVGKPVFFSINASQAGAGNLEIIVAVNGKNVPNYVQSEGNAKFRVNFKPQEAAVHSLSVRFNGEPVPGSPFSCKVVGAGQAIIIGHNLKMGAVKQLMSFIVDPQALSTNCDVIVTPSSNISLPITIEPVDGKYNISFVPVEVGRHNISILVDSEHVKGSPFACNIYDVTKVHVSGLTEALLGQATTFTVDAAEAGEGTLELVVSTENNTVKAEVVACARGLYDVTFVPQTTSTHYVNISFNDDNVPGSPFKCPIISTMLDGPSMIRVGNTAYMDLEMPGLEGPVSAEVTGPDSIIIPCTLMKLSPNLYRVEIRTRQVGTYSVIFSDGHKMISSQTLQAFDSGKVTIKEISDVVCHRPGTITVVVSKEAGPGKLTVNVRAAGADVDSVIREGENGQYDIIFHPTRAAPHKVHIKYNEVHILGSPLDLTVRGPTGGREVTATGLGLYQSCVNKVTSFTIETLGSPGKEFDVVISGPQGNAVPVRCYQHRDGNLLAEFTTSTVGTYKIDVLQGTKPVLGSPFFCQAFDVSKVKLQELGPMTVSVHDHIVFKIIKTDAGMADLDVVATSPLGQELPLQVTPLNDGAEMVEFSPSVPGTYMINITYGGYPIPDSPLVCTVDAAGQARAKGEGLLSGHVDKTAHFIVTGTRSPPAVQVDGPDSVSKAVIEAGANPGTWNVSYIPTEAGVFDIRIVSAGQQLPGSPWHPKIIDTRNLRVIGGWPAVCDDVGRLKIHPSNKISFDTAEAGPGELTGKIGDHTLSFEMTSNNRLKLIPPKLNGGEYRLEIFFNGISFPGAPKLVIVQDLETPIQDTSRVLLRGRGLTSAKCGEEVSFTIDGSQAGTGTPKVQLFSPTSELNVMLQHLGDSVYRASYIPLTPDPLLMTVSWNGRQLKGCPLQINVTNAADASRVICSGDGLKHGIVGQEIRSFIDTRRAGPGELTAHCVGPHKVAYCELYDHGDATFTLNVKPQEAGRHALTIKYAGEHVPGSPFTLRVSGAPDASKVRVYGPGIEHGVLATFQSRFICDTRGAGAGQLTVRVRGPKGAFRVEMQRETQKDRIILCRYDPTEPGDYRVEVRWAGVLVPGSPFPVKIVDTQDELLMLTQNGDNYSTGHHTIASWRGSQAIL
ncbi:filamin-A [Apis mellifera caucasica]|nr:filamin-A [Apis mellifera caucasica]